MDRSTSEALRPAPGPLSHREIRAIIGGIIVAMLLAALDQTIVATALPTIGRELGDVEDMPWVVTAYLLASTAVTPLYGKFSDSHGRRITLLIGISTFIVGSLACALAPTMFLLIAARLVQGLGGGGLISLAQTIIADGGRAIAVGADVTDEDAAIAAVERTADELGPVGVLINNAGIIRDNLIFRMSVADWDAVQNVHLRGAFLMTRAAQAQMTQARWGRIVNLSSTSALGNRGQANYAAAKAGLQGFTKTLALELGKFQITANAIAPGFIETDMTHATADRLGLDFGDWVEAAVRDIPVGRIGQPADIAAVASFLCSEEAGFVSGQVIYVAGGPKA